MSIKKWETCPPPVFSSVDRIVIDTEGQKEAVFS
jgi:hypothetical protein